MFAEVLRGKPTIHFNNNLEDAQKLTSLAKKYFGTFTVSDNHLSKVNFDWGTKRVDEEPRLLSKISWFFLKKLYATLLYCMNTGIIPLSLIPFQLILIAAI